MRKHKIYLYQLFYGQHVEGGGCIVLPSSMVQVFDPMPRILETFEEVVGSWKLAPAKTSSKKQKNTH